MHKHKKIFRAMSTMGMTLGLVFATAGCGSSDSGSGGGDDQSEVLTVGTTDKIIALDPAGSFDNGSFVVITQVFAQLYNYPYGSAMPEPDLAESGEFSEDGSQFIVKIKPGLTYANGHELNASDVKFSIERQLNIAHAEGPSGLLGNIESVDVVDELTAAFNLKVANDVLLTQILASPAAPILDEEVFSATELTPDEDIVAANAFNGPYIITSYNFNETVAYEANPVYSGMYPPKTQSILTSYFADASNLKMSVQNGEVDVAFRSLSVTDVENLRADENLQVVEGPGGEERYIVFNFAIQPFGYHSDEPDEAKALAVRKAMAHLIDREEIAESVYKNSWTPLYSYVTDGYFSQENTLLEAYGEDGKPSFEKAAAVLEEAGIETPLTLNIQYNSDHYGPSSGDEYNLVKTQLEASGLFEVNLQQTEWVTYAAERANTKDGDGKYPIYQLGWHPSYSDPEIYLGPFFGENSILGSGFEDAEITELLDKQLAETDQAEREETLREIQQLVTAKLPTLPLLQGRATVVAAKDVQGIADTLDASLRFRYSAFSK
jgi:peptide/nickel transport system substrate-binding protein